MNPINISINTSGSQANRRAAGGGLRPATSLLDVFDFKFDRYVTPIIVRVTWVLVIIIAVLWLCIATFGFVASGLVETGMEGRDKVQAVSVPLREIKDSSIEVKLFLIRLFTYAITVFATALGVLWARVALEAAIIIFHIAGSVASIDSKTPAP